MPSSYLSKDRDTCAITARQQEFNFHIMEPNVDLRNR